MLEDRVLLAAAQRGERRFGFRWRTALRYWLKHLWQRITGRFLRFGYAAVSFGAPLSLAEFVRARKGRGAADLTEPLGQELMARIRAIVPVLPVPLVAECLLAAGRPVERDEVMRRVCDRVRRLLRDGAHVRPQGESPEQEVTVAINHLLMRRLVTEGPEGLRIVRAQRPLLDYYAGSIAHFAPRDGS